MAHFAQIDGSNIVTQVIVIHNNDAPDEVTGLEFITNTLKLPGEWLQCSYNGRIRKQYPGIGYRYDPVADVFIAPQPFPSWSLDANHDWQPPTPMPQDGSEYRWDEAAQEWGAL